MCQTDGQTNTGTDRNAITSIALFTAVLWWRVIKIKLRRKRPQVVADAAWGSPVAGVTRPKQVADHGKTGNEMTMMMLNPADLWQLQSRRLAFHSPSLEPFRRRQIRRNNFIQKRWPWMMRHLQLKLHQGHILISKAVRLLQNIISFWTMLQKLKKVLQKLHMTGTVSRKRIEVYGARINDCCLLFSRGHMHDMVVS